MDNELKREAKRKYLHYFRPWFIVIGVLAVVCAGLTGYRLMGSRQQRTNFDAPEERVYDYADVLTDQEERQLRQLIAEKEDRLHIDIVLVTTNQPLEGPGVKEQYHYRSNRKEDNIRDLADDFWDERRFGYNKGFEGDGVLLLHNWYKGQNGEHLSTSGKVEAAFSTYDIDTVLDSVDAYYLVSPYKAYCAYVETVCRLLEQPRIPNPFSWWVAAVIALVAALIYAAGHLHQKPAENTTSATTYVPDGKPTFNRSTDTFLRKNVTKRHIQTSSGGGGGGSHSGGGGHHISRGGASHGGGSRFH